MCLLLSSLTVYRSVVVGDVPDMSGDCELFG